ncbi:hypothetical protein AAVH_31229 [Aphelenchoides avenae]|nr:hypothetical protein AAVH_31229 [Aphelenchus avenae]
MLLIMTRPKIQSLKFSIRYTEDSSSDRFNSSSSEPESDFYRSRQSTGSVSSYASAPVLAPAQPPPPVPITSPPTPPPPKEFQWAKADGQWTKEPINNAENSEPKVGDVRFEERNLYVTKEDLEAEIPSGAALARIAAFKQLEQAAAQSGASGTLPRSRAVTPTRKVLDSFQNGAEAQQKPMNAVQQRQSMPSQSGNSWPRNATPANGGDARRQSTPPKTNGYMPAKPVNGTVSNGTIQKAPENRPKTPTAPRWGQASPQPAGNHISPSASKSLAQPVKPTQPISVQVESNATMGRPAKPAQSPAKPAASPCATNGWVKPAHNVVAPQNSRVCPQPMKNTEPISVQVNNSPQSQRFPAFTPSPSKPSASPSNIRNADIKPISVQVSSPSQAMRPPSSTPSPSIPAASPGNGQKADVKPAQNSSSGPYRFQKNNSPGLSPQLGSPQQATNNVPRPYQTSLSPVSPKQTGPVSPASSTSSLRSSGSTPSTASSSLSMPTADDRRGRGQSSQPRAGSSSGIGTASSSAASSLSPPLRSDEFFTDGETDGRPSSFDVYVRTSTYTS